MISDANAYADDDSVEEEKDYGEDDYDEDDDNNETSLPSSS